MSPTPIVALNRCVAVAEVHGPALALELVENLDLGEYYLFHATRADLLRRLDRRAEAVAAYAVALALTVNPVERTFLERQRSAL